MVAPNSLKTAFAAIAHALARAFRHVSGLGRRVRSLLSKVPRLPAPFDRSSPRHAAILYLLLTSAASLAYLLKSAIVSPKFALTAPVALVLGTAWAVTAVLSYALHHVSRPLERFGLGSDLRLAAASGLLFGGYAILRYHFELFGVPLLGEAWDLAIEGIAAGDIEADTTTLAVVPIALLVWIALGMVFLRLVGKLRWLVRAGELAHGARAFVLVATCLSLGFEGLLVDTQSASVRLVQAQLPWAARSEASSSEAHSERTPFYQALKANASELVRGVTAERRPNIVFMIMESFRWDLISEEITPNLYKLKSECLVPERHYSTGTNTSSALSGLLHGLNSYYYDLLKTDVFQPIPLRILGKLGYERSFYHSTGLKFRNIQNRFFAKEFEKEFAPEVPPQGEEKLATEIEMFERYVKMASKRSPSKKPFFDLVFSYGTHWSYYYPPEFEKFKPVVEAGGRMGSARKKYALELKNRQRNAALYQDYWIGRMRAALGKKGFANTVWIVTGDHGEEFFEKGRFGHTWGLNDEIVRVPLFMCFPEGKTGGYAVSAHDDVFPTLFDYMGVDRDLGDFMTGKSLLKYEPERDIALVGVPFEKVRLQMAIANKDYKVLFRRDAPDLALRVYDAEDKLLKRYDTKAVDALLRHVPLSWELGEARRRQTPPKPGDRMAELAALGHSELLREAFELHQMSSMLLDLPAALWAETDRDDPVTPNTVLDSRWQVRSYDGALAGDSAELGAASNGSVEFLEDRTIALGEDPWQHWAARRGRLLVFDEQRELVAVFRYSSSSHHFAGRTRGNRFVELRRTTADAVSELPKELWQTKEATAPTSKDLLGSWSGPCFDRASKPAGERHVTLSARGGVSSSSASVKSATDANAAVDWARWAIRDKAVHVRSATGAFRAALFYDKRAKKLVSIARDGRYCALRPSEKVDRSGPDKSESNRKSDAASNGGANR